MSLLAPLADEDFNADFDADFNDDFGNFKEAFEQDNDGSGEPIAVVPPLNLDEDMDDDDDFGDFEEPEAFTGKFFQKHFLTHSRCSIFGPFRSLQSLFYFKLIY